MNKNANGKLTDEEIRRMSPIEADAYAEEHPEEAMRISRVFFASAVKQTKKSTCQLKRLSLKSVLKRKEKRTARYCEYRAAAGNLFVPTVEC